MSSYLEERIAKFRASMGVRQEVPDPDVMWLLGVVEGLLGAGPQESLVPLEMVWVVSVRDFVPNGRLTVKRVFLSWEEANVWAKSQETDWRIDPTKVGT